MRYQEFIDLWTMAWRQTRFPFMHHFFAHESVDMHSMDRTYRVYHHWIEKDVPKLFHVSAEITWVWDALLSARFSTTEEDMLMEIYGGFGSHEDTAPPWLRIDIVLNASFSYGSYFPLPLLASWQNWLEEVHATVNPILPEEEIWGRENPSSYGYRGEPEAQISFGPNGETYLNHVSLEAWQGITLPRQWDAPDKVDPDPGAQLVELAKRIQNALVLWRESLLLLIDENDLKVDD